MHARVSTFEGPAGVTDAEIAAMNDALESNILPKVRTMSGFRGLVSLLNNDTGHTMSVTLWETEQDMRASEADADTAREQAAEIEGSRVIDVERYQVTLFEMTP